MADEPTLGEVVRRLEAIHGDLKEDFRELGSRLDSKVSMERYTIEQAARDEAVARVLTQVTELAKEFDAFRDNLQREKDQLAEKRRQDKRWVIAAVLLPVALVFLQAYLAAKGAGA